MKKIEKDNVKNDVNEMRKKETKVSAKVKVNVTFDKGLLERIDEYADAHFLSRSGFLSLVASQFLDSQEMLASMRGMNELIQSVSAKVEGGLTVLDDDTQKDIEALQALVAHFPKTL